MLKVQSSRRAAGLKVGDYDHEIDIVDREDPETPRGPSNDHSDLSTVNTESRLLPVQQNGRSASPGAAPSPIAADSGSLEHSRTLTVPNQGDENNDSPHPSMMPSIEVHVPSTGIFHDDDPNIKPARPRVERETAIDILYENERGGFLCGRALFSSKALGGLDATAWTNAYHHPSPTNIHTAQVPDPTWEWVWPEWVINHQEGVDEFGWEYSFAFSKKFSWHGPKWYSSFVRRRAWTRKRIRKKPDEISADLHMENNNYFVVRSAMDATKASQMSIRGHRVPSKASLTQVSTVETAEKPDIENVETLLQILSVSRIDREKLDAIENYLTNARDLSQLQDEMHEIMSIFIFQASRKHLLARLMHIYDEACQQLKETEDERLKQRVDALQAAIKHADEETRRLAYWSDIKQMATSGEAGAAADVDKGWDEDRWQGVDNSAPTEPNGGKLP